MTTNRQGRQLSLITKCTESVAFSTAQGYTEQKMNRKCWKKYVCKTAQVENKRWISYTSQPAGPDETTIQVAQSTWIINTNIPNHIVFLGGKPRRKRVSISRKRRQKDLEGNHVVPRHARAMVALVAVEVPAVSADLTLHETLLQAERYT